MRPKATTVEHVGEWRVSLAADTLQDVFAETARVIAREAGGGSARSEPGEWETVSVSARDHATLLADWANELLGRSEAEGRAYSEVRNMRIEQLPDGSSQIAADVRGRPVVRWVAPLKAATYHGLSLERDGSKWRAVILFDV